MKKYLFLPLLLFCAGIFGEIVDDVYFSGNATARSRSGEIKTSEELRRGAKQIVFYSDSTQDNAVKDNATNKGHF